MSLKLKVLAPLAILAALATPVLAQQPAAKPAGPLGGIAAMKQPISLSTMLMVVLGLSDFESQIVHDRCNAIQADPKAAVDDKDTCALFHIAEIMMPRTSGNEEAKN
ncbi:MAG: hypothetical protein U1E56_01850 [Bauldia sp.]